MNNSELVYWVLLAHLPRWRTERINQLIVKIIHENKISLEQFFNFDTNKWENIFKLTEKEIFDLKNAIKDLPNISFLLEDMLSQGYEVITLDSEKYSKTLKSNLKLKYSPPVLYIKGNKKILHENSIAVVGSRSANETSLNFTDNVSKLASKQFKVIVSGFAKGVDKQALDSAIKYIGQSIIVLPQGILTFTYGFKQYYEQIIEGNVLVLSVFPPNAGWSAGLAMSRNTIIYGLADEIYVAQSDFTGGTWGGVKDGLRKGRKIYVRYPEEGEENANLKLIEMGAVPVDFDGNQLSKTLSKANIPEKNNEQIIEEKITELLKNQSLTAKQILEKSRIDLPLKKLTVLLKKSDKIVSNKLKKGLLYSLKENDEMALNFDNHT